MRFSRKRFTQRYEEHKGSIVNCCILTILLASFLMIGCPTEPDHTDTGFIPVGEWLDDFGGSYKITNVSVNFYSPEFGEEFPAQNYSSNIEKAVDFSNDTGVLIIKITSCENMDYTIGKYTCVYYKEYKNNHVLLANPVDSMYKSIETDSLNNALVLFTSGNMTTHVTYWGSGYNK